MMLNINPAPEHPLRSLRLERGLSQTALAELAAVSQPSVSRIESGATIHYGAVIPKIAAALDVEIADILNRDQTEFAAVIDGKRLAACWLGLDPDSPALEHLRLVLGGVAR